MAHDRVLPDCDVIMKGGISSGIVYPRAVCRLAERYRLRRLGGASAGAIAAVLAAAAEHGRGSGGFDKLNRIPDELGSTLADLFQPSAATKPTFTVLTAWLEPGWSVRRKGRRVWGLIVRETAGIFAGTLALLLLPAIIITLISRGRPSGLGDWLGTAISGLVWLPLALILATAVSVVVFGRRALAALEKNGYGLCDGHSRDPKVGKPPLTDWLTDKIDEIAARPTDGPPLTLGDLWGQRAVELEQAIVAKGAGRVLPEERLAAREARLLELEVMTTNLTLRRPYRFPFTDRIFYFCQDRLRDYFPDRVVEQLVKRSTAAEDRIDSREGVEVTISMRCPCHQQPVRRLPEAWDLPVVVAARISLSFPGLISAVPLFCVDWSRAFGKRGLVEVWFSDGGISSNFPMHFFDSLWPARPTFGINLSPPHPDLPGLVWRASRAASGVLPPVQPVTSMTSFLTAIVRTMQNWMDTTQLTLPGFRDRVAVVRQKDGEGGMNLKMEPEVIKELADRGAEAAALFDDFDFDDHRWTRYRVAMSEIDEVLTGMNARYADGYEAFLKEHGPATGRYKIGGAARTAAELALTDLLMRQAKSSAAQDHPAGAGDVPHPRPAVRLVPRQ
ncbi:hypothetical protein [Kribbella sancticallisti]|uniref:hypothetical protein n=1 Tax=Kribbella sancticallisti TaxID=460087 RepID=UPI0031E11891